MILQLFIGGVMIGVTVLFQAFTLESILHLSHKVSTPLHRVRRFWKALFLTVIVLAVATVIVVEIWLWALLYLALDALPNLETALYFSTVSFSTVGFGDVVLPDEWRLLSGIEATNGMLMFGWSVAFILEVVGTLYRREASGF